MKRITLVQHVLISVVSSLLVVVGASVAGLAAPITGSNQAGPASETEQPPPVSLGAPAVALESGATVIEFSVGPSRSDPDKIRTNIIVQKKGGQRICVNQINTDIISRSYRLRGDQPFEPVTPTELRGLTTGNAGELTSFTDTKVFIRPNTPNDTFNDFDECFSAAEAEACFIETDEDCDEVLEKGDFVCVGDGVSKSACRILDHANLSRQLRIMLALNDPLGVSPAAGVPVVTASDIGGEVPGSNLPPSGQNPGGPTDGVKLSGGGTTTTGDGLIAVPNVIGLTVPAAISVITNAGFVVGTVTLHIEFASLNFHLIRSAYAEQTNCPQDDPNCDPSTYRVDDQENCPAGSFQAPGTECDFGAGKQVAADIPEPATLPLLAVGLLLLGLIAWRRRGMN